MQTFFTNIWDIFRPDPSKIDKAKMKSGVGLVIDSMKPATTWPGDVDDAAWDQIKNVVIAQIDKMGEPNAGPVVMGAERTYTVGDANEYLNGFMNGTVNEEARKYLMRHPNTVGLLKGNFTDAQQAKIVGSPFLMMLLTTFGPMIVQWIIQFLSK